MQVSRRNLIKCVLHNFVSLLLFVNHVESLFFNFTSFDQYSSQSISYMNDTFTANGAIQLTKSGGGSVGRASYSQPVHLWDKYSNKITNFTTHFSFEITPVGNNPNSFVGDGIAFFIAPFDETTKYAPEHSSGGCLGLVGGDAKSCNVTSKYRFVAVEFDAFQNSWDPSKNHLGIDDTSVKSVVAADVVSSLKNRTAAHAWITYDSVTKNLSVFLTYDVRHAFNGEYSLSNLMDLRSILPETVRVGFSAATGTYSEFHSILSWDFNSTLEDTDVSAPSPSPQKHHKSNQSPIETGRQSNSKAALIGGLVVGASVLMIGLGSVAFVWRQRRSRESNDDKNINMDDDFDQDIGPRRFTYNELIRATSNFIEEGKLGQGGFGGVYKGFLSDISRIIAVKKISKGSKQGEKEYVSEVKVISRLRHKNLVQLLGWCHEKEELLLVYEFMPNGSLDSHIFAGKRTTVLPWADRYKIAYGLASALLYLHEEWEQCVLHRDVKSSNVMLDSDFNAKLGDFGLARLVDHNRGSQTTVLAGTLGYLAPECVVTGKYSRESDVYSLGVVALEIACGRRAIEHKGEPSKVSLVEWVLQLYGEGHLLDAADKTLEGEFDIQEMECLMIVGLSCCHPEDTLRPTVRKVINVLNKESSLSILLTNLSASTYSTPPTYVQPAPFYVASSPVLKGSSTAGTTTSSSAHPVVSGSIPLMVDYAAV